MESALTIILDNVVQKVKMEKIHLISLKGKKFNCHKPVQKEAPCLSYSYDCPKDFPIQDPKNVKPEDLKKLRQKTHVRDEL